MGSSGRSSSGGADGYFPLKPLAGQYIGPTIGARAGALQNNGTLAAAPIFITRACTADRIAIQTNNFNAGCFVRLGIYNDNAGVPGTVLLDAGTVDCTAVAGVKEIIISQALAVGVYWLASVPQGNSIVEQCLTQGAGASVSSASAANLAGGHLPGYVHNAALTAGALPTFVNGGEQYTVPYVMLRVQ